MSGHNRDETEYQGIAASVPGLRLGIDNPLSGEPSPEFTDAHRQVAKEIFSRWDGSTSLELTEEDLLGLLPNGLALGRYRMTGVLSDLSRYWCTVKVRQEWRISTRLGSIDVRSRGDEEHFVLHFPSKFGKLMKRRLDHI
jgi:hypothetical protein